MECANTRPGALVGWKRSVGASGIVLTMELVETTEQFERKEFTLVPVSMNERILRSLARDLARAAEERGIELRARRAWWKFWR